MKTVVIAIVCCVGAFVGLQLHLGFDGGSDGSQKPKQTSAAAFPKTLARAVKGEAVPEAAAFRPAAEIHPAVVLDQTGKLHEWHDRLQQEWQADTVETTELVLVLGDQKQTFLGKTHYVNAPGIRRYRYDLKAWLIEAKTGRTLASRTFTSEARATEAGERYATTELGDPVAWGPVGQWLRDATAAYAEQFGDGN
jgi:hypothetical protein